MEVRFKSDCEDYVHDNYDDDGDDDDGDIDEYGDADYVVDVDIGFDCVVWISDTDNEGLLMMSMLSLFYRDVEHVDDADDF